jgi:GntR family transcriptional regulator / MocR family aminotransferase
MGMRGGAERTRTAFQARSLSNESLIHPIHEVGRDEGKKEHNECRPPSELERFQRVAELFAPSPSLLDQMVVADFMIEGHFARHVKRMRKLYAERRKTLISALRMFFGDEIVLDVPLGGMPVIARFVVREDDVPMVARAQRAGLAPFALSLCTVAGSRPTRRSPAGVY